MAKDSSTSKLSRIGEKLTTVGNVASTLAQFLTPEMLDSTTKWLKDNQFSDKFIGLIHEIHLPRKSSPLDVVRCQCDAVDELIVSKADNLANDAPIEQWRTELDKIRLGLDMLERSPKKDRKKIKALRQRADKLYDSAFTAAIS